MKKTPKYVVMREKKKNAKRAFDGNKDVVFRGGDLPQAVVDAPAQPKRTDDHEDRPRKAKYPDYYNPAGNPFECKKIHAHGKFPSAFGSTQGFVYAVNGNNNGIFTSIFGDAIFFEIVIELFANGAVKYDLSQSAGEMQYIGNGGASWGIRTDGELIDAITQYAVECYTGLPIPIGTQIKVWGLKA